jgi:transposase-like protein
MTNRTRRNYAPTFKAKAAQAVIKGARKHWPELAEQ